MGIIDWFSNLGFSKNTLYYPGCLTKIALLQEKENYKEIFNKLGIDFVMLPNEEVCCGSPISNAGYRRDAKELAIKNFNVLKKMKIRKIITNCPSCYNTFKEEYPKIIKEFDLEIEHATISILKALNSKKIDFSGMNEDKKELVTYHDPCHLGRYSKIYDAPREIIEKLGAKIIEMSHNRNKSLCCGGGGGVRANYPEIAEKSAERRIKEIPNQTDVIIAPCGLCYSNLDKAIKSSVRKNDSKKAEEFSSFVLRKLKEFGR
jgi:Fe-S oxidoreductase